MRILQFAVDIGTSVVVRLAFGLAVMALVGAILHETFATGDTYAFAPESTEASVPTTVTPNCTVARNLSGASLRIFSAWPARAMVIAAAQMKLVLSACENGEGLVTTGPGCSLF